MDRDPATTIANWAARRLQAAQLLLSVLVLAGCGGLTISFVSNQLPPVSVTGTVVSVSLTFGSDRFGTPVTITAITLVNAGVSTTVNLCGDQASQFPIHSILRVNFTTGTPCSILMSVTVLST